MGWTNMEKVRIIFKISVKNLRGEDHLGLSDICGKIRLRWILKKWNVQL
jgi:hypothetical protein